MTKSFNYMEDALGEGAVMILAEHGATIANALHLQANRFEEAAQQAEADADADLPEEDAVKVDLDKGQTISVRPTPKGFIQGAMIFRAEAEKCRAAAKRVEDWREAANGS